MKADRGPCGSQIAPYYSETVGPITGSPCADEGKGATGLCSPQRKHAPIGKIGYGMQTYLRGIANRARKDRRARFRHLYSLLNEDNLRWCFYQLRKDVAPGVDEVTFEQYARNLEENLGELVRRLKQKGYRAKLVRRRYIPKGNGKWRPLGIPALEDKLLQVAVARILTAIYEADFLDLSWGYRAGRGPREASRALAVTLMKGKFGWAVEADIRGFFDSISHEWLVRMLEERVDDQAIIRLIGKWLKAGVMEEDGKVLHPATGTPQGGIISPVLSKIYLHYVLDLWFERKVRRESRGEVRMMRFADDFVCAFQYRDEAERVERQLPERLGKFRLEVAPEKTRMLRFSRQQLEPNDGSEFRWVRSRKGKQWVRRCTAPGKLHKSVSAIGEWIKENRAKRMTTLMRMLRIKLQGYWNYYGVRGNYKSLSQFRYHAMKRLFKWLNRRSERRSYTWQGFNALLRCFAIPRPRIVESPTPQLTLWS